ncbi:MAG: GNAT family N-acetyltransferase [Solobacterium sp.]|nr:GNAT family N-acetyltransferase [Solobacterium sp.]
MHEEYFLKTERIGFGIWRKDDLDQARRLWGDPQVTRYISRNGIFSEEDIKNRLQTEVLNQNRFGIQYWPLSDLQNHELIGCCGLRKHGEHDYELGFHLRPSYWHQGYAEEAAWAVITYAFETLQAEVLLAGHHPENAASERLLKKLGFRLKGREYYEPTGLYHPSYELRRS